MQAGADIVEEVATPSEPDGVGAFLRARRLALGLSYADVSNAVKLSARRIQALEDERWHELPDGPFLRGFLRNVARALDIDAAKLTERVDASLMRSRNPESILVPPGTAHAMLPRRSGPLEDRHSGRTLIIGACVFAVLAALIAWSGTASFDRMFSTGKDLLKPTAPVPTVSSTTSPTALTPSTTADVPKDAAGTSTPTTEQPTSEASNPISTGTALALIFHFNEDSWVEVRSADGKILLKALNPAGSDQEIEGEAPFSLIVGNAKGVALRFRGQPIDLGPHTRDQVARLTLS